MTFAEKVIQFNASLELNVPLPQYISVMNPFRENEIAFKISSLFYKKFFDDLNERFIILGINPGRFGAGVTGVPFTDTKRLSSECGLTVKEFSTHEPSSVFVYDMIKKYGGPQLFYSRFFITALCPLGFVKRVRPGKEVNCNYYDYKELQQAVTPFIIDSLKRQITFGIKEDVAFCLGNNHNFKYLYKLNEQFHFFKKIIPLEHPRFIMQYKAKKKDEYVMKYVDEFLKV